MKVLMIDTVATVHGSFYEGRTYEVEEKKAKKMIDRGLAKDAEQPKQSIQKRRTTSLKHGDKG